MEGPTRKETDSLGEVQVPADALWGAQTQRAIGNFPVSGQRLPRRLIRALALIKKTAAEVNRQTGDLDPKIANAIIQAAHEVATGQHDGQFPVDVFQTGSGTSSNMNANEVIANRAIQLLGGRPGTKTPVHPNDHVNKGSSRRTTCSRRPCTSRPPKGSSAICCRRWACSSARCWPRPRPSTPSSSSAARTSWTPSPCASARSFRATRRWSTNTLRRVGATRAALAELPLGGTAVGTGLGADPRFAPQVIELLVHEVGLPFAQAPNLFEALAARDGLVEASGALRGAAVSLTKIANDVRWLGSGPRGAIGEIHIPDLQPGSSIMPGKVNPVMSEMLLMVCAQVIGYDATIAWGGAAGNFELNVMIPVMAASFLSASRRTVERLPPVRVPMRRRPRRQRRARHGLRRAEPGHGDGVEPAHRLRRGGRPGA